MANLIDVKKRGNNHKNTFLNTKKVTKTKNVKTLKKVTHANN